MDRDLPVGPEGNPALGTALLTAVPASLVLWGMLILAVHGF